MEFVNKIQVVGKIIKDVNVFEGKMSVLKFTVVTEEVIESPDKTFTETTFHNIVQFDVDRTDLKAGDWVEISGSMKKRKYSGKYYDQITATEIKVLKPTPKRKAKSKTA